MNELSFLGDLVLSWIVPVLASAGPASLLNSPTHPRPWLEVHLWILFFLSFTSTLIEAFDLFPSMSSTVSTRSTSRLLVFSPLLRLSFISSHFV